MPTNFETNNAPHPKRLITSLADNYIFVNTVETTNLTLSQAGWLVGWLVDCLVDCFIGWLISSLFV